MREYQYTNRELLDEGLHANDLDEHHTRLIRGCAPCLTSDVSFVDREAAG